MHFDAVTDIGHGDDQQPAAGGKLKLLSLSQYMDYMFLVRSDTDFKIHDFGVGQGIGQLILQGIPIIGDDAAVQIGNLAVEGSYRLIPE